MYGSHRLRHCSTSVSLILMSMQFHVRHAVAAVLSLGEREKKKDTQASQVHRASFSTFVQVDGLMACKACYAVK